MCDAEMLGVRFPGLTHPGIIGTAPSMELLNIWNEREKELEENGLKSLKLCEVLHSRPLANLPSTKGCLLGKVNLFVCGSTQPDPYASACTFFRPNTVLPDLLVTSIYK